MSYYYNSAFKPSQYVHSAYTRPASPIAPPFEPFSPLRPMEPTFNYQPTNHYGWDQKHARNAHTSEDNSPNPSNGRAQHWPPTVTAARQSRHSVTMDQLATVALKHSPALQLALADSQSSSTAHNPLVYDDLRPAKRPRSTYSHDNTLQHDDRRREHSWSNIQDAQLLLNFASRNVSASHPGESPQPPLAAIPAYVPPIQSYHSPSHPSASHSQTLDSRPHVTHMPRNDAYNHSHQQSHHHSSIHKQSKTHTYEPRPSQGQSSNHSSPVPGKLQIPRHHPTSPPHASIRQIPKFDPTKPKNRRGWPKGKARGPKLPRKSLVNSKTRTTTTTTDTLDDSPPPSLLNDDPLDIPPPRRHSFSSMHIALDPPSPASLPRSRSVPADLLYLPGTPKRPKKSTAKIKQDTVCIGCKVTRKSLTGEVDQWISCDGCNQWFHTDCAGFDKASEIKDVDKFFCPSCRPNHGPTTFVRKSGRAHTSVNYAGLNQGVLKTSDDCHEHHYIEPIKNGKFVFDEETFARIRPELVTMDYLERISGFTEPLLIPAEFNEHPLRHLRDVKPAPVDQESLTRDSNAISDDPPTEDFEYESAFYDGQDKLDMVIPQNLTVRQVCQLVGPDYPLEVIDVKVQGTEGGKWNLQKWADYYEATGEKAIRNVISLEVSQTKLGKLLRRPRVVRQIDLQDSVWPGTEPAKSVAFYCLMSVADSFTDFHIDFGGSSVYYHILRGKKTFFFIPPKPKHLKAYEEWNNSHEQNFTFLPDITKECYRVDLFPGDTMLIPSGWIHAVWTPETSLVIGGNFLTRMHYSMQFRICDIERNNKTPLKFRYPFFQKVMWYSVLRYLDTDPLPDSVRDLLNLGKRFERTRPSWEDFDECGSSSATAPPHEDYHARYYSQMELDGLPELASFVFRTVMISLDRIEGVTEESRKAVVRSIPKTHGDPLVVVKTFALWMAWKRGNEDPPAWARPDAVLPVKGDGTAKKLSARALKNLQRQEALEANRSNPERQSSRQQQQVASKARPKQEANKPDVSEVIGGSVSTRTIDDKQNSRAGVHEAHTAPQQSITDMSMPLEIIPMCSSDGLDRDTASDNMVVCDDVAVSLEDKQPSLHTDMTKQIPAESASADSIAKAKACSTCRRNKRRCVHGDRGAVGNDKKRVEQASRRKRPSNISSDLQSLGNTEGITSAHTDVSSISNTSHDHTDGLIEPGEARKPKDSSVSTVSNTIDSGIGLSEDSRLRSSSGEASMSGNDKIKGEGWDNYQQHKTGSFTSFKDDASPFMHPDLGGKKNKPVHNGKRRSSRQTSVRTSLPEVQTTVPASPMGTPRSAKTSKKRKASHTPSLTAASPHAKKTRNEMHHEEAQKEEADMADTPHGMTEIEMMEEESLRLARELAGENFGLRRRKSLGI